MHPGYGVGVDAVELTAPVGTTTGTYQGLKNFQELPGDPATGVNVFLGIRYGQAPVGTLRWKPPQAPNPGQGSIVAGTIGHTCVQGRPTDSEDCLFLNVYTPSNATARSKLPVFVWIHGGALVSGAGSDYDPSVMVADNDIIVVTINYRLGSLGFLAAERAGGDQARRLPERRRRRQLRSHGPTIRDGLGPRQHCGFRR